MNLGLLVIVALVPLLLSWSKATPGEAPKTGFAFGTLTYLIQLAWLIPLVERWTGSYPLAIVPWLLAGGVGGVYYSFLGWGVQRCYGRGWPWLVPFVWAGFDVLRSSIPGLAFPWALVATPLWPYPSFGQLAFVGTIHLVSAWVVLVNVMFSLFLADQPWKVVRRYGLASIVGLMASLLIYGRETPSEKKVIVAGQLGVDLAFGNPQTRQTDLQRATDQIFQVAALNMADLTVLPEGLTFGGASMPPVMSFTIPDGVPVLFGGQRGAGPIYQTAFVRNRKGDWSFADKSRLVVFGEYVPGRDWLPFLDQFKLPTGDLTAADNVSAVEVDGLKVGPLICFEGLFWDVAHQQVQNGARVLAVMSLDDWYIGTPAPDQLRAAAVWRAIETGLPVVRSAPLGYTIAIDGKGNVLAEAETLKTVGLKVEVPVPLNPPKYPFRALVPISLALSWLGLVTVKSRKRISD